MIVLGSPPPSMAKRDMIHIGVMPVQCDSVCYPGEHVTISPAPTNPRTVFSSLGEEFDGVIDPFLGDHAIDAGQEVWMLVNPNRIQDVRHDFNLTDTLANDIEPRDVFCCAGQKNEYFD